MTVFPATMAAHTRQTGFSLLEIIITIVVLGIAAVAILSMFGQAAGSLAINEDIQTAAQLAQSCSEHVLATRRASPSGYTALDSTVCDTLPTVAGFVRSVIVSDPFSGAACPGAAPCKELLIKIQKGAKAMVDIPIMVASY